MYEIHLNIVIGFKANETACHQFPVPNISLPINIEVLGWN